MRNAGRRAKEGQKEEFLFFFFFFSLLGGYHGEIHRHNEINQLGQFRLLRRQGQEEEEEEEEDEIKKLRAGRRRGRDGACGHNEVNKLILRRCCWPSCSFNFLSLFLFLLLFFFFFFFCFAFSAGWLWCATRAKGTSATSNGDGFLGSFASQRNCSGRVRISSINNAERKSSNADRQGGREGEREKKRIHLKDQCRRSRSHPISRKWMRLIKIKRRQLHSEETGKETERQEITRTPQTLLRRQSESKKKKERKLDGPKLRIGLATSHNQVKLTGASRVHLNSPIGAGGDLSAGGGCDKHGCRAGNSSRVCQHYKENNYGTTPDGGRAGWDVDGSESRSDWRTLWIEILLLSGTSLPLRLSPRSFVRFGAHQDSTDSAHGRADGAGACQQLNL